MEGIYFDSEPDVGCHEAAAHGQVVHHGARVGGGGGSFQRLSLGVNGYARPLQPPEERDNNTTIFF